MAKKLIVSKNKYEMAIEAMQAASKLFSVRFDISYQYKKVVSRYHQKWVIKTMGQTFYDGDFIKTVRKAIVFAKKANGSNVS